MTKVSDKHKEVAAALKRDGYSGGVVARRMIEEHKMPEAAALELVQSLYGERVDPRGGETTTKIVTSVAMIALGLGGVGYFYEGDGPWTEDAIGASIGGLSLAGAGLVRLIIAWVNAGVKERLGPPKPSPMGANDDDDDS